MLGLTHRADRTAADDGAAVVAGRAPTSDTKELGFASRPAIGIRRVDWVRLEVDDDGRFVRAEARGVGFRLPVTCLVTLATAFDLIASGVPYVTCHTAEA